MLHTFELCTQACPFSEERNYSFYINKEMFLPIYFKRKNRNCKQSPDAGKVSAELTEGASVSRNEKNDFYRMVLNTCLSFLNEGKKRSGIEKQKSTG